MLLILILFTSFIAGVITLLFSFGLNVTLVPVLSMFISIERAIAFTAITFLFYNSVRISLTWRYINWKLVLKFIPLAILGVITGGVLLNYALLVLSPHTLKIFMGIFLLILVFLEFFKVPQKLRLHDSTFIYGGGFISGLAGGLTGFQGPFRVAALLNLNLEYQVFLATNTILGFIIDFCRVVVYLLTFLEVKELANPILAATILGSMLGFLLLFKITKKIIMEKFKIYILGFIVILVIFMMLT